MGISNEVVIFTTEKQWGSVVAHTKNIIDQSWQTEGLLNTAVEEVIISGGLDDSSEEIIISGGGSDDSSDGVIWDEELVVGNTEVGSGSEREDISGSDVEALSGVHP